MIEVAAAVIQRPDGSFLLAQRPAGKVYAGYWEFPGGKIEPGEHAASALTRELHEELGIDVERSYPWITRVFTYPHGTVRLNFFRIRQWKGDPHGRENQAFVWQRTDAPMVEPMLPANAPVLASLALPVEYAVTCAAKLGTQTMLALLEQQLRAGLKLLQIREPGLDEEARNAFTAQVVLLARRYDCKVLTKSFFVGADGVHLSSQDLMRVKEKPPGLAGASCHAREELDRAMELGFDFAVLGPLKDKAPALGWEGFRHLARGASIPIYAIGGMTRADLEQAWSAGAHGVAMIRGAWS